MQLTHTLIWIALFGLLFAYVLYTSFNRLRADEASVRINYLMLMWPTRVLICAFAAWALHHWWMGTWGNETSDLIAAGVGALVGALLGFVIKPRKMIY